MSPIWRHAGLLSALLAAWTIFALVRLLRRSGRNDLRRLAVEEKGAAAVEFALSAPVLLALVLLVIQFALVAVARRAVEGAAFAAARSAVVWIPDDDGEGANRLRLVGTSAKRDRIERAAALALLPAAPAGEAGAGGSEPDVAEPLRALARETEMASAGELVRRYAAARSRLRVEVRTPDRTGSAGVLNVNPNDPLTVTVVYDCPLHVPLVGRLLGGPDALGEGFRTELVARCTMWNEGTPESDLVIGE
jgi:hypothetical protein